MDFKAQYAKLAAMLGDVTYKIELLGAERAKLLSEIRELDALAGKVAKMNGENSEAQKQETEKPTA
jgi:hypothetical protein